MVHGQQSARVEGKEEGAKSTSLGPITSCLREGVGPNELKGPFQLQHSVPTPFLFSLYCFMLTHFPAANTVLKTFFLFLASYVLQALSRVLSSCSLLMSAADYI